MSRCNSIPSLLLLLLASLPAAAESLPLRAFTADYELHRGDTHVANSEMSLNREGEFWRWTMMTRARGVYAWLVSKQPVANTIFDQRYGLLWLQEISVGDADEERSNERARFDWSSGRIDVERKGKRRLLPLSDIVYDYQSIHLLAAEMLQRQQETMTVDFYRKGKLVKSSLTYTGTGNIDIDGVGREASVFEQTIVNSDSRLRYYYDAASPLVPLRIEKLEDDDPPTVLTLRRVEWTS